MNVRIPYPYDKFVSVCSLIILREGKSTRVTTGQNLITDQSLHYIKRTDLFFDWPLYALLCSLIILTKGKATRVTTGLNLITYQSFYIKRTDLFFDWPSMPCLANYQMNNLLHVEPVSNLTTQHDDIKCLVKASTKWCWQEHCQLIKALRLDNLNSKGIGGQFKYLYLVFLILETTLRWKKYRIDYKSSSVVKPCHSSDYPATGCVMVASKLFLPHDTILWLSAVSHQGDT